MNIDPNIKFSRVKKGYDPQEVDAVFDEFQRQLQSYREQIGEYDAKITQLAESTGQLEQERAQESLRLSEMLSTAAQVAEQSEKEAKAKSDEIILQARLEAERITAEAKEYLQDYIEKLNQSIQILRQNNERYIAESNANLSELNEVIAELLNGSLPETESENAEDQVQNYTQHSKFIVSNFTPSAKKADPVGYDPYTEYLKNMEAEIKMPQKFGMRRTGGNIIGHFGD